MAAMKKIYQPKFKPRPAQIEALAKMRAKEAFALLLAPRTGKTKVIIDDFGRMELHDWCDTLVVIAPGGVYKTWIGAFKEHASADLYKRTMVLVWDSDDGKKKRANAVSAFFYHEGPRVLLMNVEALSVVKDARDLLYETLAATSNAMLAIDESTKIKNSKAQRAKYVCGIGKEFKRDPIRLLAKWRRILSGLPTPRSPLDLFMQFYFLDPRILGHDSFYTFRARYAIIEKIELGGRSVPIVVGYRNEAELQRKIAPHMHRVEFRPKIPTTFNKEEVEFTPEQRHHYSEMLAYSTTLIEKAIEAREDRHVVANVVIAQLLKLHTICQGFAVDEFGKLHSIKENKTKRVMDLLDRIGGKTIIWCSYDYNIRKLHTRIVEEYGLPAVARFWGGNKSEREAEEHRFKNDRHCSIMLATPHAGGMGRTWDVADTALYFSNTNDLELRDQSEQRTMAVEKERAVDNYDIYIPGTVEWKILQALRKKINMAGAITGDTWREWLI